MNAMQTETEIRENLADAGVNAAEAETIIELIRSGDLKVAERLITDSRKRHLERMHESQRCIDSLRRFTITE